MSDNILELMKKNINIMNGIKKDAKENVLKDTYTTNSPVLFNQHNFQSDIAMIKFVPIDPLSKEKEDEKKRENYLGYYDAIFKSLESRDFEQKPYKKG